MLLANSLDVIPNGLALIKKLFLSSRDVYIPFQSLDDDDDAIG